MIDSRILDPSRQDRFRVDNQFWFPSTTTTTPVVTLDNTASQSMILPEVQSNSQQLQQQQQQFGRSFHLQLTSLNHASIPVMNNQRWMETTTARPNIDSLPVINDDRFGQKPFNRFWNEVPSPSVMTTTSTPLPMMSSTIGQSIILQEVQPSGQRLQQQQQFGMSVGFQLTHKSRMPYSSYE